MLATATRSAASPAGTPSAVAATATTNAATISTSQIERLARPKAGSAVSRVLRIIFIMTAIIAFGIGWSLAERKEFIPNDGVGYWLGIAGGTALFVQLAYPLRKRMRFMRRMGSGPVWFRTHMILGVVGPLLILYHSNYSLGATNSNVALFAMLIVAGSGVVGRYFYGKVHNGLYGSHSNLQDLLSEATALLKIVEIDVGGAGGAVAARLTDFGERVLQRRKSLFASFGTALWLGYTVPLTRWRILAEVHGAIDFNAGRLNWGRAEQQAHYKAARLHVRNYLDAVVKASELSFYDRLFALWHLLHMPLYFLLIVTGIVHVIAVHLY